MKIKNLLFVFIALATNCVAFGQENKMIVPEDPESRAKFDQISRLTKDARSEYWKGRAENALGLYDRADAIERTLDDFHGTHTFARNAMNEKAMLLVKLNRNEEALAAYKQVYRWNAAKGDLACGSGGFPEASLGYALLLSKVGKVEEAKAMYYFVLRNFNPADDRQIEPVPFIRVFDPDPEGSCVEYSPPQFEAAALMIMAMHGGSRDPLVRKGTDPDVLISRVKELAPDWFYPYAYLAALGYAQPWADERMAQADARANTIERQLMERLRVEIAEVKAINAERDTPDAMDVRPMKDGNARRKRMQVLRPNPEILKSLASG